MLKEIETEANEAEAEFSSSSKRSRLTAAAGAAIAATAATAQGTAPRRLWVKARSRAWWDECNSLDFPEMDFKAAFRMGRATFEMLCGELSSVVAKEDTTLRAAVPVPQRVAVCVWRLATGEPLRLVSKRFGLGISTCHKLVLEVCSAIWEVLRPKYISWPSDPSQTKNAFELLSGIPDVVGTLYTTHVPIIAPKTNVAAYFNKRHTERNQKTSYSITLQGVIDPNGIFTDVCIGWPGSMTDGVVLEKSVLYQRGESGQLQRSWVIGGTSYPLMDWLLVPYSQHHLTWTQHAFNEKVSALQEVAKKGFGRLKGRWACLQKRTEVKLQDLPMVLGACCVLHNLCESTGEELEPRLEFDVVDDEVLPETHVRSAQAMQARDGIAHNLLHHAHAGTAFL
ncbi:hypothetical protein AMTR_s00146p00085750 [Amborella trichopoda]|uniref:DDE Tnp4 domain-containing protein n=2 Tax=Amborella trichopoda TaxID=13333 RepID=W1PAA9_AMBTC|nr:hypothetical protein AMTR_s00146p00085750 [Amborella trichopoda]